MLSILLGRNLQRYGICFLRDVTKERWKIKKLKREAISTLVVAAILHVVKRCNTRKILRKMQASPEAGEVLQGTGDQDLFGNTLSIFSIHSWFERLKHNMLVQQPCSVGP